MKRFSVCASVLWIALWLGVALHCALSGRSRPDLKSPMGPAFRPSPAAASATFGVLGDCHSHRRALRSFLRKAEERGTDFAIQLGDFVDYADKLTFHHFVGRLGVLPFPIFLVRGNHETVDFGLEHTDSFLDYIPQSSCFFEHAGMLVGILDNSDGAFADTRLVKARERIASFRERLPDGPVLLAMHLPPSLPGTHSRDLSGSATRILMRLCDDLGVDYIVAGHVHDHVTLKHGDTQIVIDGCGGGSLQGPSPDVHYLEFTVRNGQVASQVVPLQRDRKVLATLDYFLFVSVLRYRWLFFIAACAIILREAWSLRRLLASTDRSAVNDRAIVDAEQAMD